MPIYSLHPQLNDLASTIEMCEDFVAGAKAVKDKTTTYLPKLTEQKDTDYSAYLYRAGFYGASGRTVDGLTGAVMRRLPTITVPSKIDYIIENATEEGLSLNEVITQLISSVLVTGRPGILVDRPNELAGGGRPYLCLYTARNIINWDKLGKNFIVLKEESYEATEADPYYMQKVTRYRELTLTDGIYRQRMWESPLVMTHQEQAYQPQPEIVPVNFGEPVTYLPFTFVSPTGVDPNLDNPPILNLVYENALHYRVSADYNWALHWLALPTPYLAADLEPDPNRKIYVGAHTVLVLPAGSKVGFAEFTGQGLGAIEKALEKSENRMAALGARLIEPRRSQVETAEASRIRQSGESSVMAGIITAVETAVTKALRWVAEWEAADPNEVSVVLNRDLLDTRLDANMVTALLQGVNSGRVSRETFYYNLQQGGYTIPDDTYEAEEERIKDGIEMMDISGVTDQHIQPVKSSEMPEFPS